MRNYLAILILLFISSCQVLDKREVLLSNTFCKSCQKPLEELMLKSNGVFVVKYKEENTLFYNYDKALVDIDSLEYELMRKGYLPRKDSIIMHPACCNVVEKEINKKEEIVLTEESIKKEEVIVKDSATNTIDS